MSTRSTIFYTEEFHIYDELLDGTVHIEVDNKNSYCNFAIRKSSEFPKYLRDSLKELQEKIDKIVMNKDVA